MDRQSFRTGGDLDNRCNWRMLQVFAQGGGRRAYIYIYTYLCHCFPFFLIKNR